MTALDAYEKLECLGTWRRDRRAQRRDVAVSIGNASLVISDLNDTALAHWSLAAVNRLNPGERPALFSPDQEAGELLELDEELIIDAIEQVRRAVRRQGPQPGRVRLLSFVAVTAAVLIFSVFLLPGILRQHTVRVVPEVTRAAIGETLLRKVEALAGSECRSPGTQPVLAAMRDRLTGLDRGRIIILSGDLRTPQHLPGGLIVLNRYVVEDHDGPEVLAGHALAEGLRARDRDPLDRLLQEVGAWPTLRLLTTGEVSDATLESYAETLLASRPAPLSDERLLATFEATGVPATPYALALDETGTTTLPLIEGDPFRDRLAEPLMSDADWIRLQGICS